MSAPSSSSTPLPVLSHLFRGTFIHANEWGAGVQILRDRLVGVLAATGRIAFVAEAADAAFSMANLAQRFALPAAGLTTLRPTQFFVPGFIDTHCHAPQFQFAGAGTDRELMVWLKTYTFPAEMRMESTQLAALTYARLVAQALSQGTTTAFYYATIHLEATKILADTCASMGQRAFVGKVAMDQHGLPGYTESTEGSLKDTESFIHYCKSLPVPPHSPAGPPLVHPVVTPRFIPTCSPALLQGLGDLAKKHDVWIQSHASESSDQVDFVASLLPEHGAAAQDATELEKAGLIAGRCTGIFNHFSLLSDKCMMAHGTFLEPGEWNYFKARGVSIAHCPLSNFFCSNRYLKLKPLLNNGNKVGLGSDVAGGYALGMLSNIRQAVLTSKAHTFDVLQNPQQMVHLGPNGASAVKPAEQAGEFVPGRPLSPEARTAQARAREEQDNTVNETTLSYADAFWLATAGGAESINMGHELGRFGEGFLFDAQLIDVSPLCPHTGTPMRTPLSLFPTDSLADVFQKWVHLGDDRHVQRVYVQGRQVHGEGVALPELLRAPLELPAPIEAAKRALEQEQQEQRKQAGSEVAASAQA